MAVLQFLKFSRLNNNYRNVLNNTKRLYAQIQTQTKELIVDHEPLNVSTRVIKKRPSKPPFMKNIFLAKFDTDLLAFPEVLDKEELKEVNNLLSKIYQIYSDFNLTQQLENKNVIKQELKKLKVYGLQASKLVDGLELSETENARILEAISQYRSLGISLINHQYLGVNLISSKANEHIINKYLNDLSRGNSTAAFCLLEDKNFDPLLMKTRAVLSEDGKNWILNGKKSWVINGDEAEVFVVVAQTTDEEFHPDSNRDRMSVMIVDKSFDGISTTSCKTAGFKEAGICDVSFNDTPVPVENVLGEGSDSMKLLTPSLTGLRLSTGPGCIALLKTLIKKFSEFTIKTKHGDNYICDTDIVKDKLAKININLYAIESITYMTAGLLDKYENQDCDLESAIVKVFSSEKCLESVQQCIKLIGSPAFNEDHWIYSLYNDALGHAILNETNDSLRTVIALLGLQHSGVNLQNDVKKARNPFFFPGYAMKKIFEQRRQIADDPKLSLELESYLHPTLNISARWLEYCVFRLQFATETMLIMHGPEIMNRHMELMKLADVAMDVYAMAAVLSRASRSYCIGLQNADGELLLANAFCLDARERVKQKVLEISRGQFGTNDANFQHIAKRAFKFDGYYAEHALTKNF